MDDVLDTADAILPQVLHNSLIRCQRDPASIHFAKAALVNQLLHSFQGGITIRDVWLNTLEQICDRLVDCKENTVVNLPQPQKLQDLPWLRSQLVDTVNAGHKQKFLLRLHEEVAVRLR